MPLRYCRMCGRVCDIQGMLNAGWEGRHAVRLEASLVPSGPSAQIILKYNILVGARDNSPNERIVCTGTRTWKELSYHIIM